MQKTLSKRQFLTGIIGNIFEQYDSAIFGLLAPFLAPLFFPDSSPLNRLIYTYGLMLPGILTRPLGALFFGYLGDRWGRKRALSFSLMGMALTTVCMGCLPIYKQIGSMAPLLLTLLRSLQNFFGGGESVGGAIFVLESVPEKKRSFLSGVFDSSSILGGFLAAVLIGALSGKMDEFLWRIPFFLGAFCGIIGIFIRLGAVEPMLSYSRLSLKEQIRGVFAHRSLLLPIILAAGFSYTTYVFAFTFTLGFVPLVSQVTQSQACFANSYLLLLDFLLLPIFGMLANKIGKERLMRTSALQLFLLAIPLFSLLQGGTPLTVFIVRLVIMYLGVGFAATYHHWSQERVPPHLRYTMVSLATSIGATLIGLPSAVISLWLYKVTGWSIAPAFYLMLTAGLGMIAIKAPVPSRQKQLGQ